MATVGSTASTASTANASPLSHRDHNITPTPRHGSMKQNVPSSMNPREGAPRIRDGPVSPVRVNFHQDNWAQPSNANIEHTQSSMTFGDSQHDVVDHNRPSITSSANLNQALPQLDFMKTLSLNESHHNPEQAQPQNSASASVNGGLDFSFGDMTSAMSQVDRVKNEERYRDSRESDGTTSTTHQQASMESSVTTSASSVSGRNEKFDSQQYGGSISPESSTLDDNAPQIEPVPGFQYHHLQETPQIPQMNAHDDSRTSPDSMEGAGNSRRHLTPSQYYRRSSLPRPQSSYSISSEVARGRSPGLLPGGSHLRAVSSSRKSPDVRPVSTYAELLNVPYVQQQAPAPFGLDNSNLRTVIGNNASLLSTQKTLEMYRQNVKKTTDVSIQYSFAVFLISTAQEQGLDFRNPKGRKNSPQPLRDHDSPIIEATVTSPQELVKESRQILQRLANGGYPFAQYYLADGLFSGLFNKGKEDHNSAFPLFVLAAKHGHAESGYRTALCYEFGWGCRKDPAKAIQFLRTAASKRHPGAMTRLGKACLLGDLGEKRYREGIKWMKLASESADTQYNSAPYQLGCLYETGYGEDIFQDTHYAAELFTQAAELGHPEANFRMGDAYEHGKLNCPRDPSLSVHFYTGAAERGHAGAMMGLCAWYMVGAPPILDKDQEEAYEWARRSAELGFVKAQFAVGYFTENGVGCRRDILEANVWYVKAADAGDERAKQRLAIIQAAVTGGGTPMDVAPPRSGKITKENSGNDKDCIIM